MDNETNRPDDAEVHRTDVDRDKIARGQNPADANDLGRMPVGVAPGGQNINRVADEQAEGVARRAGEKPDAGPIVTDKPSHSDDDASDSAFV